MMDRLSCLVSAFGVAVVRDRSGRSHITKYKHIPRARDGMPSSTVIHSVSRDRLVTRCCVVGQPAQPSPMPDHY
ncbi:hypothetical protein N656DRAFT_109617 [Canariomyces notabilis]|uniref:Uncharacterized protein n=1 Tax=Canariomyces notabilis TaxID=2074819 RepID=A0AAN6YRF5_9PEZI|nr:hypothetical protein N656DRAFT_109617 [Canariomyces arenarius]